MTTNEGAGRRAARQPSRWRRHPPTPPAPDSEPSTAAEAPNWWHRSHPVFTPLSGFYAGLAAVIVLPGIFGALLNLLVNDKTAERLAPYALVVFTIPLVLVCVPRTRRFGRYMLLGMVLTAVVVAAVAAATVYFLIKNDG